METQAAAGTAVERALALLGDALSAEQRDRARSDLTKWVAAWLDSLEPDDEEELRHLAEEVLPAEVEEQLGAIAPAERYDFAVTAHDRWRVRALSERTFERARTIAEGRGERDEAKRAAEADLAELRDIEARLRDAFPAPYATVREHLSESKLDSYYVLRDGGATSLRLDRVLSRRGG